MIRYGAQRACSKGLGASGLRGPEPKCKSNLIYLNLVARWPLCPRKETWYPLYRRLDVSQGCSGWVQKILPVLGFDHQNIQPVASLCTNCVIAAHTTRECRFYYLSPVISRGLQGSINESGLGLLSWWASS